MQTVLLVTISGVTRRGRGYNRPKYIHYSEHILLLLLAYHYVPMTFHWLVLSWPTVYCH